MLVILVAADDHGLPYEPNTCEGKIQPKLRFSETAQSSRMANHICCHNKHYAEPSGFLSRVNFFSQLKNKDGTTTFYDSVCGKPLFVAPKGRTMAEFERESLAHGWPSFRPAEVVQANVKILEGGEMVSTC